MKLGFRIKVNLSKIDQSKCFKGGKNNDTFLDATVFYEDIKGDYGDNGMITQDPTKEESLAAKARGEKAKGVILGNLTEFWWDEEPRSSMSVPATSPPQNNMQQNVAPAVAFDDDIPF